MQAKIKRAILSSVLVVLLEVTFAGAQLATARQAWPWLSAGESDDLSVLAGLPADGLDIPVGITIRIHHLEWPIDPAAREERDVSDQLGTA